MARGVASKKEAKRTSARSSEPARTRPPRLLAWYRVVPLLLVALLGGVCAVFAYAPSTLFGSLYPLSYEELIADASDRYGISPYLVAAVIETESGWDADAESSAGAVGLMQLMPDTAREMAERGYVDGDAYPADDLTDPAVNIEYGCAYLAYLLDYYDESTERAIAAYNAGMGSVNEWLEEDSALHNAITFPETQAYLARVELAITRYQELYPAAFS